MQDVLGGNVRILFIIGAIPPALTCVALLFWPESPKHLLLHVGDEAEARKAIEFFHGKDADVQHIINTIELERTAPKVAGVGWTFELKYALFVAILATIAQMCCGQILILTFATLLLKADLGVAIAQKAAVGMTVAALAGNLLGMFVIERFPRRVLLLGTLLISTLAGVYYVGVGAAPAAPYAVHASIMGAFLVCAFVPMFGVGTIGWFLVNEMVIHEKRSVAQSLVTFTQCLVISGISFFFLPLLQEVGTCSLVSRQAQLSAFYCSYICLKLVAGKFQMS